VRISDRQKRGSLAVLIASMAVYAGGLLCHQWPQTESMPPWADQNAQTMAVEIAEVHRSEGIYFFPAGTPFSEILIITGLNVKSPVQRLTHTIEDQRDPVKLSVREGTLTIEPMPAVKRLALGLPIDVNRASFEEFMLVPGIGEIAAGRIIQLRQLKGRFESVSELSTIQGLKGKKFEGIRQYLTVTTVP